MNELIHISDSIKGRQNEFNTDTVRLNLQKSIITIKPIINFPLTRWEITGLILISLLIAAVIFFFARRFIHQKILKSPGLILKNTKNQARQKLDELTDKYQGNLITLDQYYLEASLVIRDFIAGELKIDAPYLTSEQLVTAFYKFNIPGGVINSAYTFFQEADKVKFSAYRPGQTEVNQFTVMSYQILDDLNNLNMIKI